MAFIDDFKLRFPDIDTITVDKYFPLNETSYNYYYNVNYGDDLRTDEAILFLMAHLITTESSAGSSPIKDTQSKSVDGVSVAYTPIATTSGQDQFFMSTKYGQKFLQLTQFGYGGRFV